MDTVVSLTAAAEHCSLVRLAYLALTHQCHTRVRAARYRAGSPSLLPAPFLNEDTQNDEQKAEADDHPQGILNHLFAPFRAPVGFASACSGLAFGGLPPGCGSNASTSLR